MFFIYPRHVYTFIAGVIWIYDKDNENGQYGGGVFLVDNERVYLYTDKKRKFLCAEFNFKQQTQYGSGNIKSHFFV